MRLRLSLGVLWGGLWLGSGAFIPSPDGIGLSTCSSTVTEQPNPAVTTESVVLTLTIPPGTAGTSCTSGAALSASPPTNSWTAASPFGQSSQSGFFNSSSCTASETIPFVSSGTAGATVWLNVTVTELPTPSTSTLTVTLSGPSAPSSTESFLTTAILGETVSSCSLTEATVSSVSAIPAPQSTATVTVPSLCDSSVGSGNATSVVLTVTLPADSGSPSPWPAVMAAPAIADGPATTVTVTVHASPSSSDAANAPRRSPRSGLSGGENDWFSLTTKTITISLSDSGQSSGADSQTSDPYAPFTVTYTLSPDSALPMPFTGTITVTPVSPAPTSATDSSSSGSPGPPITITITEPVTAFSYTVSTAQSNSFGQSGAATSRPNASSSSGSTLAFQPSPTITVTETVVFPVTVTVSVPLSVDGDGPSMVPHQSTLSATRPARRSTVFWVDSRAGAPSATSAADGAQYGPRPDTRDTVAITPSGGTTVTETAEIVMPTPSSPSNSWSATSGGSSASIVTITVQASATPASVLSTILEYGDFTNLASGADDAGSSATTVGPASASPIVVTTPLPSNYTFIPSNQPSIVTITGGLSSAPDSGADSSGTLLTVTVSESSFVLPIPLIPYSRCKSTTGTVTPTSTRTRSPCSPLTVPTPAWPPYGFFSLSTVVVSEVTSKTVPIGPGSSSMVQLTTQLSPVTISSLSTTPVSTVPATPAINTLTAPQIYGYSSNASTYGTHLPLYSSLAYSGASHTPPLLSSSSVGGGDTGTWPTQSPEVSTIWPYNSPSLWSSGDAASQAGSTTSFASPSLATTWPSASGSAASATSTACCSLCTPSEAASTSIQPSNPVPSEVTIWPPPHGSYNSCMTMATVYLSAASSVLSATASPLFPITTLAPVSDNSAVGSTGRSSSCGEAIPGEPLGTDSIETAGSAVVSNSRPSNTMDSVDAMPSASVSGSETGDFAASADLAARAQTGFRHPAHAATDVSIVLPTSTPGGYIFSSADTGYGNQPPAYGTQAPSTAASAPAAASSTFVNWNSTSVSLKGTGTSAPGTVTAAPSSVLSSEVVTATSVWASRTVASSAVVNSTSFLTPPMVTSAAQLNATGSTTLPRPSTSLNSTVNATILTRSAETFSSRVVLSTSTYLSNSTMLSSSTASVINATTTAPRFPNSTTSALVTGAAPTSVVETSAPAPFPNSTAAAVTPTVLSSVAVGSPRSSALNATIVTRATASNVGSNASPSAVPVTSCGEESEYGALVFDFDDIPTLEIDSETGGRGIQPHPVTSPYHRFSFSRGFHVAHSLAAKYEPSSGIQMLQYNPTSSSVAQIGVAQLRENACFRFDFLGVSLGCNSADAPCTFQVAALQWNGEDEVVLGHTTFEIAACLELSNCTLSRQVLSSTAAMPFTNVTAIDITLVTAGIPQTWWADDLQIAWTDNDCMTAACRAKVPDTIMILRPQGSLVSRAKDLLRWALRGRAVQRT